MQNNIQTNNSTGILLTKFATILFGCKNNGMHYVANNCLQANYQLIRKPSCI